MNAPEPFPEDIARLLRLLSAELTGSPYEPGLLGLAALLLGTGEGAARTAGVAAAADRGGLSAERALVDDVRRHRG